MAKIQIILLTVVALFYSVTVFGACTEEQRARMIANNISQAIIDKQCSVKIESSDDQAEAVQKQKFVPEERISDQTSSEVERWAHKYIGIGVAGLSSEQKVSGRTLTGSGSSFGIGGEFPIGKIIFVGFFWESAKMTYELEGYTGHYEGDISATSFELGGEIQVSDKLIIELSASQSSSNLDLTYYASNGGTASTSSSADGMIGHFKIVIPVNKHRAYFGMNKGVSDDYSDSDPSLSAGFTFKIAAKQFIQVAYVGNSEAATVGGLFGFAF